jgi:sigma-54-specific transcriptional regulator
VGALHRNRLITEAPSLALANASSSATQPVSDVPILESLHHRLDSLFGELISAGEPELFDSIEGSLIRTAFKSCGQNQVHTAKVLGISRNILRTHLKHFGIIGFDTGVESSEPSSTTASAASVSAVM